MSWSQRLAPAYRQSLKHSMRGARYLRRLVVFLVLLSMTLLLIVQLGARLLLPFINDYKGDIEDYLARALDAKVSIARIGGHFEYFIPFIDVVGVRVANKQPPAQANWPQSQYIEQLSVGINPIHMARARSWLPNNISVHGVDAVLIKHVDGSFSLPGIKPPAPNSDRNYESFINAMQHKLIQLSAGKLRIFDAASGNAISIAPISLDYLSSDKRRRGFLSVPTLGSTQRSYLRFDLEGRLREPQTWVGSFNLRVAPQKMQNLLPYLPEYLGLNIKSGHAGIELSANFDQSSIKSSHGKLDIVAQLQNGKTVVWQSPVSINGRAADFRLRAERAMSFANTKIAVLTDAGVEVNFSQHLQLGFYAHEVELAALSQLLGAVKALPPKLISALERSKLQGGIEHIFAGWDARDNWLINAKVVDFASAGHGFIPQISPVAGRGIDFDIDYHQASLKLKLAKLNFDLFMRKLYDVKFKVRELEANLQLLRHGDNWLLQSSDSRGSIDGIKLDANWQLAFAKDQPPHLKLKASAAQAPFSSVARYTPKLLGARANAWFAQAFISGEIKDIDVNIDSRLDQIADNRHAGVFKVRARAHNARFSFEPRWPAVHSAYADFVMDKAHINIKSTRAATEKLFIDSINVDLADIRNLAVNFDLRASKQPLNEAFAYINNSGIAKLLAPLTRGFAGSGLADFNLKFKMNLGHQPDRLHPYLDGEISLADAALYMPALKLNMQALRGAIKFSEHSLYARELSGNVNGAPLKAYISTIDQHHPERAPSAQIDVSAWLNPAQIFPTGLELLTPYIKDSAYWNLRLNFGLGHHARPAQVQLSSQLYDSSVELPPPFNKPKSQKLNFNFSMPLDSAMSFNCQQLLLEQRDCNTAPQNLPKTAENSPKTGENNQNPAKNAENMAKTAANRAKNSENTTKNRSRSFGNGHLAALQLGPMAGQIWFDEHFKLASASFALNTALKPLPASGIGIDVIFDDFVLLPWRDYVQSLLAQNPKTDAASKPASPPNIDHVYFFTRNFYSPSIEIKHLLANLQRGPKDWYLQLDSEALQFKLRAPFDFANNKQQPLKLHVQNLNLNRFKTSDDLSGQSQLQPGNIPPLHIAIDALQFADLEFKNINLRTHPQDDALILDSLSLRDSSIKLLASGSWQQVSGSPPQSELTIDWRSPNMHDDLHKLGLDGLIGKGSMQLLAQLHWQRPIYDFDFSSLNGKLELSASDGVVSKIKPGFGKLLGLLNAKSLPKRLLGNFDDFAQSGLSFTQLDSKVLLMNGIANFKDTNIATDLGNIELQGRVDVPRRSLNMMAALNPELSSVLPITAAIVGGVPGFLGGVLLDRVLKNIGASADNVAQIRYTIKGPWADVQVQPTQVRKIKELSEAELAARLKLIQQSKTKQPN